MASETDQLRGEFWCLYLERAVVEAEIENLTKYLSQLDSRLVMCPEDAQAAN